MSDDTLKGMFRSIGFFRRWSLEQWRRQYDCVTHGHILRETGRCRVCGITPDILETSVPVVGYSPDTRPSWEPAEVGEGKYLRATVRKPIDTI